MLIAPSNPIIQQAGLAESLPKTQPDVAELHRHKFPRKRHPKWRTPEHRAAANRIIERARGIDQPRISSKLGDSDYDSEEKKSREQCVTPNDA